VLSEAKDEREPAAETLSDPERREGESKGL
jgi:hypothetical protein